MKRKYINVICDQDHQPFPFQTYITLIYGVSKKNAVDNSRLMLKPPYRELSEVIFI